MPDLQRRLAQTASAQAIANLPQTQRRRDRQSPGAPIPALEWQQNQAQRPNPPERQIIAP